MIRILRSSTGIAAIALATGLAACSQEAEEETHTVDTDLERASTDGEARVLDGAVAPRDFGELQLGGKIVGPQGPEVTAAMSNPAGNFADIRSYVRCPAGMDPCDPQTAPEGTVFTYVHVVIPGEDMDAGTGDGESNTSSDIENAEGFVLTSTPHGFTGRAGYSKAEALAAMGRTADIAISCEGNNLAWTVNSGDGGDQWEQGEPLTFWWQSTLPPAGASRVYEIQANYATATGDGPYPAAKQGVRNACEEQASAQR